MAALITLGLRLTRAGGWFRFASIAVGCALGVILGTLAWDLPRALERTDNYRFPIVAGLLAMMIAPVIVMITAMARLSSETRDRRLGSLLLLGVGRSRLLVVGLVEVTAPAVLGSLIGVVMYLGIATGVNGVIDDVVVPLSANAHLLKVTLAVTGLAIVTALAPLRRLGDARASVSPAAANAPSLWRLLPVPIAFALFGAVLATPIKRFSVRTGVALIGAAVACTLSVITVTPLVVSWFAKALARGDRVSQTIAGRGIQAQGAAAARRITVFGVTAFVSFVALGYMTLFETDQGSASAIHEIEQGPQEILVVDPEETPISSGTIAELSAIPGVEGVVDASSVHVVEDDPLRFTDAFVGTCAQLALLATVSGCDDGAVAWIARTNVPEELRDYYRKDASDRTLGTQEVTQRDTPHQIEVTGVMTHDVEASTERWVIPTGKDLFIPTALAREAGLDVASAVRVIAGQGSQVREAVIAAATDAGLLAFAGAAEDYDLIVSLRVATWSVLGATVAVALGVFAVSSIDRARANRRGRARLVAIGIPARVLRRAEQLTTLLPLVASLVLAFALATAAVMTLTRTADVPLMPLPVLALGAITLAGAGIVSLLTMPLTRSHVRAEDLRQE